MTFGISYSLAPEALNPDEINATRYMLLSNLRDPLSEYGVSDDLRKVRVYFHDDWIYDCAEYFAKKCTFAVNNGKEFNDFEPEKAVPLLFYRLQASHCMKWTCATLDILHS